MGFKASATETDLKQSETRHRFFHESAKYWGRIVMQRFSDYPPDTPGPESYGLATVLAHHQVGDDCFAPQ